MSADLERWMYGNPENILLRQESATCKGCAYLEVHKAFGQFVSICLKKKKATRRCSQYKEAE